MRKWAIIPRSDVIFLPRDWQFKFYPRGFMFSISGTYTAAGRVAVQWFRIGPPSPAPSG